VERVADAERKTPMDFSTFEKNELHPEDYHRLLPYFKLRYSHTCENILVSHFMWKNYYDTHYMRDEKGLIWLMKIDGQMATQMPLCTPDDLKDYFNIAQTYFNEVLGIKMVLYLADKEGVEMLDLDPEAYDIIPNRDNFDYVYDAQKMMTFSGKAYHKKKNHVNAFKKMYDGRYEYRTLGCGCHKEEIMAFLRRWEVERDIQDEYNRVDFELAGIEFLLSNCSYLDYKMGGIYIDGQLEAFSLGVYGKAERMAVIHVEKANPDIRGLYPFICQQFLIHEFPDALLVNREDDMGLEGLRKSKLSYNPIYLEEKYEIRQK
jgi:hypothetical protein